jgi:hypothetical protein
LSSLGTTLVVVDVAKLGVGVVLAIFRPVGQVKVVDVSVAWLLDIEVAFVLVIVVVELVEQLS